MKGYRYTAQIFFDNKIIVTEMDNNLRRLAARMLNLLKKSDDSALCKIIDNQTQKIVHQYCREVS